MLSALSLAALSLALGVKADDAQWPDYTKFGNMFYSGPTSNGAYITKATYSMVPPATPCGYHDGTKEQEELALWIGVQADPTGKDVMDMNLVQPLLNWAPDQSLTYVHQVTVLHEPWLTASPAAATPTSTTGALPPALILLKGSRVRPMCKSPAILRSTLPVRNPRLY